MAPGTPVLTKHPGWAAAERALSAHPRDPGAHDPRDSGSPARTHPAHLRQSVIPADTRDQEEQPSPAPATRVGNGTASAALPWAWVSFPVATSRPTT
jgi:hypothetical protein